MKAEELAGEAGNQQNRELVEVSWLVSVAAGDEAGG